MNTASRGDGIPVELFQILKDDAVKVLTQYASKFGKFSSGHRTGKGQFSFQSQRKAMPKNDQTATQLHSLLALLWNTEFRWVYFPFSPLLFTSCLFTAICKGSSDSYFAFLHFFFLMMVLIPVSCSMS